jgi:hypothetical protein
VHSSMGSFKTGRFSTLMLLGLLAWIAYVLIAPEIDLDDATFLSKGSPLAIHALTRHVPQAEWTVGATRITFPSAGAADLALAVLFDKAVEVPSAPPRILRC